jgi:RecA-family ATPase
MQPARSSLGFPMLDLHQMARALGGEVSGGEVLCPGPGHSPNDKSLSVKISADGTDIIVHSFAEDDAIVCKDYAREKIGLPAFTPNGNGRAPRRPRASRADLDAMFAAAAQPPQDQKRGQHVATFDYKDKDGTLLYQVLKFDNPRSYSQRRPDGSGGFIHKLEDRRVLYRLQELLEFPDATVFVCEGEKDANTIAGLGHCSTTVASGSWTAECVEGLRARDVIVLQDNDDAGRKKALIAAQRLYGVAASVRIVLLPDLPDKGDVTDWLSTDPRRKDKFINICFDAPLWAPTPGMPEIKPDSKPEPAATPETPIPLPFINIAAWHHQPVPEREWCVLNRIPLRNVTLFSGEGAIGKSITSLHLGAAHVLGRDWLGSMPEPGPVLVFACEDETDELHRRLAHILDHYGASFANLKDMHLISMAGEDALLAAPDRLGLMQHTKLFERLRMAAIEVKPKLIVLDNSADVFGGGENDRAQVRQFIGILRGLAIAANAGVLLTSHPSLTGINTGTGVSGSTAWNASVRSRLYMKRAITEKDEEPDPDLRVIEVMKNNYGPVGETITVRWKDGLFLPVAVPGSLERMAREQKVDDLFLKLLDRSTEQGRNLSDKKTANTYAPSRFAGEPEAKADHITKREMAEAMERLFRASKICNASYGLPSKGWTRLERK